MIGSQLPPIIKDDVDTMLLSGESYRKVQQRLEEDGIKLSQEMCIRDSCSCGNGQDDVVPHVLDLNLSHEIGRAHV